LALASAVLLTLVNMLVFLAYGTTGSVGRALGAGDEAAAARLGLQSMWLGLALGAVLGAALYAVADPLLRSFDASDEVVGHASTYLKISCAGVPALLASLAGTGYLRGLQDTKTPLVVAVSTAAANAVIEIWLVFGLDMGIAGSAWSTVIAETIAAVIYTVMVLRSVRHFNIGWRPSPSAMRVAGRGGLSLVARTAALRGAFLFAVVVAASKGTTALAAHEIAVQVWMTLALALDAIAIAGQALVARLLGAGDAPAARAASARMIELAVAFGLFAGAAIALSSGPLARVFTEDTAVIELTAFLLLHVAVMQPIGGHVFALDGILIGASDLAFLAKAMWASTAVFAVAAAIVWSAGLGIGWLWASLTLFMVVRAATLHLRYRTDLWLVTGATK
ncbi:MAG: MATE family efflux transporter, partial [Acidimicrobiales bacterium]|nr:MATE family efflux transporter [Acidimicrobiales bacterium]